MTKLLIGLLTLGTLTVFGNAAFAKQYTCQFKISYHNANPSKRIIDEAYFYSVETEEIKSVKLNSLKQNAVLQISEQDLVSADDMIVALTVSTDALSNNVDDHESLIFGTFKKDLRASRLEAS